MNEVKGTGQWEDTLSFFYNSRKRVIVVEAVS